MRDSLAYTLWAKCLFISHPWVGSSKCPTWRFLAVPPPPTVLARKPPLGSGVSFLGELVVCVPWWPQASSLPMADTAFPKPHIAAVWECVVWEGRRSLVAGHDSTFAHCPQWARQPCTHAVGRMFTSEHAGLPAGPRHSSQTSTPASWEGIALRVAV